ncbi:MAG: hypothetical protein ACKV22_00385 [Bryobacteraceae bacterium]
MRLLLTTLAMAAIHVAAAQVNSTAVGHEFRQDDWPAITATPEGTVWTAWLSFNGDRDDVAIRQWNAGTWGSLQWVPGSSGDSWMPQLAADASSRVWVVWPQQVNGNWDLYARRFDPSAQQWSRLERLTTDPLPDIDPRVACDGKGRCALVWQAFRNGRSHVLLKTLDGETWSPEIRITGKETNHWEPAVAISPQGVVWVVYDSYANGNYDVYLRRVEQGRAGEEMAVARTPRFEARATVAVDGSGRVWVAWEEGRPNWGKDYGYVIRDASAGVPLGGYREGRIRCLENGRWREPAMLPFPRGATWHPHVFADAAGTVAVAAKIGASASGPPPGAPSTSYHPPSSRVYWEYRVTQLNGNRWTDPVTLPDSKGRISTRIQGAFGKDSTLWFAWPTDNRSMKLTHRPLRQQVFAGSLRIAQAAPPELRDPVDEPVEVKPAHADEAGDVRAIRAYTAAVGGKRLGIVRGDFHRHTEFSWDRGGEPDGSLHDFYRYMIDAGAMDFGASTDHQGGAWPYWWWLSQKMTDLYHAPGAYIPIFGYERSAVFPNGHRNMFFAKRSDSRVTPFFLKQGARGFSLPLTPQGDEPIGTAELVSNDTKLLYEDIRPRNAVVISHTSGTRMGTDWRDNDPDLEPVVEIFQGCRTNYEQLGSPHVVVQGKDDTMMKVAGYQPEGMVSNAWAKGYKLGIIASSDHFSTHISYAMVYTADRSRQGILDAIRKRHTYGATDNIILDVRMGPHFMGDEFPLTRALPLKVKARGTRPVVRVDVIKDSQVVYSAEPKNQDVSFEFTDKGDVAGRHFYYVRVLQDDQMIAWSSPMFINYGK